ncbi:unnamed protein product [Penicillium pancosmium]
MPGKFLSCEDVEIYHDYHDLTSEDDDTCLWCWEDLRTASIDDPMSTFGIGNDPFEGVNSEIPPFEFAAQFNPQTEREDSSDLVFGQVASEHYMSDFCSVISSGNPEDHSCGQNTLETDIFEQLANILIQTEEEEPLLVHNDLSEPSSPPFEEAGSSDSELEAFGFFLTPREIL